MCLENTACTKEIHFTAFDSTRGARKGFEKASNREDTPRFLGRKCASSLCIFPAETILVHIKPDQPKNFKKVTFQN